VPKRKVSSIQDTLGHSPIKSITPTASSTTTGAARSPHPSSHHSFLSEHSRDRSNSNSAATSNKKPRVILPPANNKRIHDFFSSSKKKPLYHQPTGTGNNSLTHKNASVGQTHNTTQTSNISSNNNNNNNNQSIGDSHAKNAKGSSTAVSNTTTRTTTIASAVSSAALLAAKAATEEWQAKCAKLQQKLQDKDEQLKAVTGNKTILHTALQQALTKTRKELQGLMESTTSKTQKVNSVLEETFRWKFERQAKELRATLSADGNRLGRIVSARAGMRVIDTWEEGYASRDWQVRKEEWKSKHRALIEKQERLKQRLNAQQQNQQQGKNHIDTADTNDSTAGTTDATTILSPLEVQEAQESIQMHMEALLREEKELLTEEQTLNDEKGAHIRALKRVASEDASRFKNRTKLHDRYVLDCLLGKGGFSEVWKGYDLRELREVAVKIHQLDPRWPDSKKENYTKHVSREYEIHRNVRHSRIVSLFDVFEIDNNSFATVLECCKGTDLDTLLKRKKRLPERQARSILLQILTGMQYLSQPSASGSRQGIIHYDLKPGNILFDEFGDAKITDFGLSKIVDTPDPAESMELTSQGAGTYWYLPPECFVTGEQVRISNKVDVWSIGVIFYQMLYGLRPFGEGKSQDKLLSDHTMLNAQDVHLPEKPAISEAGKDFVKQCLTYDQAFRPTIAQLCENPYALQRVP
jgi:tousled-like kinase